MSNNIKVSEIASEAATNNQKIIDSAKDIGIAIKTAACKVSEEEASAILDYILNGTKPKIVSIPKNIEKEQENKTKKEQDDKDKKLQSKSNSNQKNKPVKITKPIENNQKQQLKIIKKINSKTITDNKIEPQKHDISQDTQEDMQKDTQIQIKENDNQTKQAPQIKRKQGSLKIIKKNRPTKKDIDHGVVATKTQRKSLSQLLGNTPTTDDKKTKKQKTKKPKQNAKSSNQGQIVQLDTKYDFFESEDSIMGEEVVLFDMGKIETSKFLEDQPKKKQTNQNQHNRKRGSFGNRPRGLGRKKPQKKYDKEIKDETITDVTIPKECRVYEFANFIGKSDGEIIGTLFKLGLVVNKNNFLNDDEIEILAEEYGISVTIKDMLEDFDYDNDQQNEVVDTKNFTTKPPVVTIMGHVDHGKTSLLDKIRDTQITKKEIGGITQHITAYTLEKNGKHITFVDTPGHEAFMTMREHGANITDISIIVVAADDGVKPQTIESIKVAKKSNTPIIIAVNKMDKETANLDMVKTTMATHGITANDWGGDTEFVPVSALKGDGIDDLLETINIQAEIMELKADPTAMGKAVVLESSMKKGVGAVASVIVQSGELKIGDPIVADTTHGKIKAIINDTGMRVKTLKMGFSGEVIGLDDIPTTGVSLVAIDNINEAKNIAHTRYEHARAKELSHSTKVSLDEMSALIADGRIDTLPIILKTDTGGSLQALQSTLQEIKNDEVKVKIISSGVGAITQTDLDMAKAGANCIIVGFNVRPTGAVNTKAKADGISINTYSIIYDLIDDIKLILSGMMSTIVTEENTGQANVLETFVVPKIGTVAGTKVTDGKVIIGGKARVIRDGIVIYTGKIASLKRFKDDVKEVKNGFECGIIFEKFNDIQPNDYIETFIENETVKKM